MTLVCTACSKPFTQTGHTKHGQRTKNKHCRRAFLELTAERIQQEMGKLDAEGDRYLPVRPGTQVDGLLQRRPLTRLWLRQTIHQLKVYRMKISTTTTLMTMAMMPIHSAQAMKLMRFHLQKMSSQTQIRTLTIHRTMMLDLSSDPVSSPGKKRRFNQMSRSPLSAQMRMPFTEILRWTLTALNWTTQSILRPLRKGMRVPQSTFIMLPPTKTTSTNFMTLTTYMPRSHHSLTGTLPGGARCVAVAQLPLPSSWRSMG